MKKSLLIFLTVFLALVMGLNAFADLGSFVNSPSNNKAPVLMSVKRLSEDCTAELIITAYADRDTLPEDARLVIEQAYADIVGTNDITALNSDLAALAESKNIAASDLAVSDLFDISYYGCEKHDHDKHLGFDIAVSAETLEKFVGFMHFHNGEWELVKNAKVEEVDGTAHLYFTVEELSPFAIIVNTNNEVIPPKTGDSSGSTALYVILMIAAASVLVFVVIKRRKASQIEK